MKNNIMLILAGFLLLVSTMTNTEAGIKVPGTIIGTGTKALLGGDLTDPEDDGAPEEDTNYNAKFTSSDEPGFGGGEFAFNVFDNILGPGNDKWCCGKGGIGDGEGMHITAELDAPHLLTHYTLSSANDVPDRDPTTWEVQGSNDGEKFTTIFSYDGDNLFTDRLQVIRFDAGEDFDAQTTGYRFFRHITFKTANWPNGAFFQIGEIEYFGTPADDTAVDPRSKLATQWGILKNSQ